MKNRRVFLSIVLLAVLGAVAIGAEGAAKGATIDISEHGGVGEGATLNTKAIQGAIDELAAGGGGTLVVPKGEFLTGALCLKGGVNLELREGAVLKGSSSIDDYPVMPSRFEGHFQDRHMSLINVEKQDHLRISGPGMLDGNGEAYWKLNAPLGRPRLMYVGDSTDVRISGVHFMNSGSWNLHLYNCRDVVVEDCRFEISKTGKGPSTDGTDIDSCQWVTVRGCFYSVNDDCVCLKGNRYDGLDQKPESPAVANVHVVDCTFERGMGALSLGTEATSVHDVEFEGSTVKGNMPMLRVKMRPDTPGQDYENIKVHDIVLETEGKNSKILSFELTHGTKVAPKPPKAVIKNVDVENIKGSLGPMGSVAANDNT